MKMLPSVALSLIAFAAVSTAFAADGVGQQLDWQAGLGRRAITPRTPVWLAGYGTKRPPDGKIHDLWVKVLALRASDGKRVVMATTDHMGMSKTIYENLYAKIKQRFSLDRSEFMLTFSHNHCGPVLKDDLVDYYPLDDEQRRLVAEYSDWMADQVVEAVGEALGSLRPARLLKGEGKCTFAVNRRENTEAEVPKKLAEGAPLKGVVDHYVPVLAIRDEGGKLLGVLFGYACHPTTLSWNTWCGDYPGFAQVNLEAKHPGTAAMFFNACGGDQNPIPRRKLELCVKYGKMLSDAVDEVLLRPMQPVSGKLRSAFEFVDLAYDELVTRDKLLPIASGTSELHARWAKRMLKMIDDKVTFPTSYPYPVQAWQIGNELLLIGIGGEAVVDYSLRFKREFGPTTWVCGYANDMAAYIPSRRVWNEGGYEGGPHLDEYGRPAWRWAGDVEDRVAGAVHRVVQSARGSRPVSATSPSPGGSEITITDKRLQREPISPMIYGNFMELLSDLVPAMWAEKLDGTSFEYLRTPQERELHRSRFTFDPKLDPHDRPWRPLGKAPQAGCDLDADRPFNGQVSQRIRLAADGTEAGIAQDGIFVEKGESYRFIGHFRRHDQAGPVLIELRRDREIIAREAIHGITAEWAERQVTLIPTATTTAGTLAIRIATPGTVWIDRISLMPTKTIAGWRPDAVAAIRAMKPGVIRWGGSIIEGYSWRDGIGPWQKRVPFPNRYWGRVDPNVVGVDEFVAFCRATEAEPLVCVRWSGQKPSDAAEMVEYCNGPASTPLGALRAQNGHRESYGVKFWQIGNEVSGPAYDASFAGFARAMRKADPSIKIFASYVSEDLLKNAADLIDYVCPHQYACADLAGTEAEIRRYAELLARFAPGRPIKLAVTEWNTTAGGWGEGRHHLWTLANGLACARYLNLCHRWSDLVKIACRSNMANSYCSGIIQTNNHAWYGTPAWHVAKLYAEHGGTHPLVVEMPLGMLELDVSANLSADGKSLSLIAVNSRGKPLPRTVNVAAFAEIDARADVWTIANDDAVSHPEATNSFTRPERIAARVRSIANAGKTFSYAFPPYSVTLIRLRPPATSRVLR